MTTKEIKYETQVDYPINFFDFSDGKEVFDEEINEWIIECWNIMQKTGETYYCISSGNTLVQLEKNDDGLIVRVCKDYQELSIDLKDIIKSKKRK